MIPFPSLSFPPFEAKIKEDKSNEQYIWDISRKKYIFLTPEEWVRQHAIHFLCSYLHYPLSLLRTESGHKLNKLSKRTDIIVYNNEVKPFILVECKAYDIEINQNTLKQAIIYNQIISAQYIYLTNGKQHIFLHYELEKKQYSQIEKLPTYTNVAI